MKVNAYFTINKWGKATTSRYNEQQYLHNLGNTTRKYCTTRNVRIQIHELKEWGQHTNNGLDPVTLVEGVVVPRPAIFPSHAEHSVLLLFALECPQLSGLDFREFGELQERRNGQHCLPCPAQVQALQDPIPLFPVLTDKEFLCQILCFNAVSNDQKNSILNSPFFRLEVGALKPY